MGARDADRGTIVSGTLLTLLGGAFLLDSLGYWSFDLVFIWPLILIGFGTAVLLGRAQRMEVEVQRSSDLAVAEQRVRIAQELHDIVAHSVSLMTVQITAARKVMDTRPEDAEKALADAEETGRRSLGELRRIVGVLRSADQSIEAASLRTDEDEVDATKMTPVPGFGDLYSLIEDMKKAGLDVTYQVAGRTPTDLTQAVQLTAYRVVQEALTNVVRHSPKSKVNVAMMLSDTQLKLVIFDDALGNVVLPRRSQGHGLIGMKERLLSVGGTLEVGPAPEGHGWVVNATIPLGQE